ncbi:hypothetical protein RIR_jg10213.t1 [Rhizophagus irregularis DAOM 181602=DAOM 197198]|nr:hypothetical protein RIR_jg10213.t1 [Rhizophagus irregularis DAOM 181602=DAOM 197198]
MVFTSLFGIHSGGSRFFRSEEFMIEVNQTQHKTGLIFGEEVLLKTDISDEILRNFKKMRITLATHDKIIGGFTKKCYLVLHVSRRRTFLFYPDYQWLE